MRAPNAQAGVMESLRQLFYEDIPVGLEEAIPPLELLFAQQILGPVTDNVTDTGEQEAAMAEWLVSDEAIPEDGSCELVAFMCFSFGAALDGEGSEEFNTHIETSTRSGDPIVCTVVRMPQQHDVPTLTLLAIVRVRNDDKTMLYNVEKRYEFTDEHWARVSSDASLIEE